MNGLISCSENCKYQKDGECSLDNVPKFCLELNSKKACIYYVKKEVEAKAENKRNFEAFF